MDKYTQLKQSFEIDEVHLSKVFRDLAKIKESCPIIDEIGFDGGAVVDLIMGFEPKDYDLRYTAKMDGKYVVDCVCEQVIECIKKIDSFEIFTIGLIDLGNINEGFETEVAESLEERVDSIFAPNACFNNIGIFTSEGKFLCSDTTFNALLKKVYSPNFLGYMSYYHRNFNHEQYYEVMLEMIVRGASYISKRNLSPDDDFIRLVKQLHKLLAVVHESKVLDIIQMKFRDKDEFVETVSKITK